MKKAMTIIIAIIGLLTMGSAAQAQYLLDDYFGVHLSVDNNSHLFNMPWNPTRGYSISQDWPTNGNAPDPGQGYDMSEVFDIEAMYADFDQTNHELVYSIVTSMPNTGFNDVPWYPGYLFRAGDIRFGVQGNNYVVGTFDGQYSGHNYNTSGNFYVNPTMQYRDGSRGFGSRGNPVLHYNSVASNHSNDFQFGYSEYLVNGHSLMENGYSTYVMEGRISFDDLGGWNSLSNGMSITLGMSCNNDILRLDVPPASVPEPATIGLFGMGLAGLLGLKRKFKK